MKYIIFYLTILLIFNLIICFKYFKFKENFTTLNGINSFDRVFYINLDNRFDRKQQILNEIRKNNINMNKVERLPAVYNKDNGHIGCAESHKKIMEIAMARKYKNILVLEDDFVFIDSKDKVNKRINEFLNRFGNDWDIVQLSTVHKKTTPIYDGLDSVNYATTSSGYLINQHFYPKLHKDLSESINKMKKELTDYKKTNNKRIIETRFALDQHWSKLQKESKWYLFNPYIGKQGGEAYRSSIMNAEGFQ